jgi:hypothetical protein
MLSGLIPRPPHPRNDSNAYAMYLVEDLKLLWYNIGVEIWNEHKHEYF